MYGLDILVHGRALDKIKNGALQDHFYLLPAIKQRDEHSVAEPKWQQGG